MPYNFLKLASLAGISLALSGCFSVMSEKWVGPPATDTETLEEYPVGHPRVNITPHDDGLGWTIAVEHMIERQVEEQSRQSWNGRRYVFSPLSLFAGMVQCPFGLLQLFDRDSTANHLRYGCARLLMFEPLDGSAKLPPTVSSRLKTEQRWKPLVHGVVQIVWPAFPGQLATYSLNQEGRVELRLPKLLSRLILSGQSPTAEKEQAFLLRLRHADGVPVEHWISVLPAQLRLAHKQIPLPIPKGRWPSPLILKIGINPAVAEHESPFLQDRVTSWALQQRICTVAPDQFHQHLFNEYQVQYSGAVDDAKQVPLGRLLPASAILAASVESQGAKRIVTLQVKAMREGEAITTVSEGSRSESILPSLESALAELDLLMANAPKTGCPRQGKS